LGFCGNADDSLFAELKLVKNRILVEMAYCFVETLETFFEAFADLPIVDLVEELILVLNLVFL
jgi:hypothetical protein